MWIRARAREQLSVSVFPWAGRSFLLRGMKGKRRNKKTAFKALLFSLWTRFIDGRLPADQRRLYGLFERGLLFTCGRALIERL